MAVLLSVSFRLVEFENIREIFTAGEHLVEVADKDALPHRMLVEVGVGAVYVPFFDGFAVGEDRLVFQQLGDSGAFALDATVENEIIGVFRRRVKVV
ncbi:MAG: hypothetical protein IIY38_02250, partial [Clostridia bacterium]|nr:hypothetical protein [Clostridia bacterium]